MRERKRAIRAKTFRAFMLANLREYLSDIAEHGADCGYPWLTYTSDTVRLFEKFAPEIWEMASRESDDLGCKNVAEMIAGFNRADMLDDWSRFQNLMVWYAAETIAREYADSRGGSR